MSSNGHRPRHGTKVTPADRRYYRMLRDHGLPPEAAARAINRSRSWAYSYEKELNIIEVHPLGTRGRNKPAENLSDAVDAFVALREDDADRFLGLLDQFGLELTFSIAEVALYLARLEASNLQMGLQDLFEGEEWEDEVTSNPITAEDVLLNVTRNVDRYRAGEDVRVKWMPPRAESWMDRLLDTYPNLKAIAEQADAALQSADSRQAFRELRDSTYETTEDAAVERSNN